MQKEIYFVSWNGPLEASAKLRKEVELCLEGELCCLEQQFKKGSALPVWDKEITLFPEVQLMPLGISEGYHDRRHFEERPVVSGRYNGLEQVASGEIEIQGSHGYALGLKPTLPPALSKHLPF